MMESESVWAVLVAIFAAYAAFATVMAIYSVWEMWKSRVQEPPPPVYTAQDVEWLERVTSEL